MTKRWIQQATKRTSPAGRRQIKAGSVREIMQTGRQIRSQIRHGRLPYSKGVKRLVLAHNLLKANPNVSKSDRRIRALRGQIRRTQALR